MSFDHIFVARVLFTLMTAGWAILTVVADFNKTHATNPAWTPHARFHVVWQISSYVGFGLLAFALIWWPGPLAVERLYLVALMGAISVLLVLAAPATGKLTAAASNSAAAKEKAPSDSAVFFAADGMRQDIVARYAAQGLLPTMSSFLKKGVSASGNGLLTEAPPNTGAGWYSLATGAWPGVHGSTNNTFHRTGEGNFNNSTSFAATGILQADHIAQAAERAGKKVASVEWVGVRNLVPAIQGPVVDFRSFFSRRGVVLNYDLPGQPAGANAFGVDYQTIRMPVTTLARLCETHGFATIDFLKVDVEGGEADSLESAPPHPVRTTASTAEQATSVDRRAVVSEAPVMHRG